jgi:hypothetical protein
MVPGRYIAQRPHFTEFSGADPGLAEKVTSATGWPAAGELAGVVLPDASPIQTRRKTH